MDEKKFKLALRNKNICALLELLLLVALYYLSTLPFFTESAAALPREIRASMNGMRIGAMSGAVAAAVGYGIYSLCLLKNPARLRKVMIKAIDERCKLVQQKASYFTFLSMLYLLVSGMLIASNFSQAVAMTLWAVLAVMIVLYYGLNLFFRKRY